MSLLFLSVSYLETNAVQLSLWNTLGGFLKFLGVLHSFDSFGF